MHGLFYAAGCVKKVNENNRAYERLGEKPPYDLSFANEGITNEELETEGEKGVVKERDYIRHVIGSSQDFQMTLDKSGKIMDVNEVFEHIVGKRREDIIGTSICQYMQEEAEEAIAHLVEVEKVRDIELTIDLPGKGTLIGNFYGAVFTTPEGELGVYITDRDITKRKKAEEALNESRRYTRELIEVSLDPLVTISAEGKITDVNHATESFTGYPREKLIGTDFSHYFTDPQIARHCYQQVFREGYEG